MENVAQESNDGKSGDTQSDVTTESTNQEAAQNGVANDAGLESGSGESVQGAEGSDENSQTEFVKDREGKEYIPKAAFDKRLGAEVAKRKKAEEILEGIRNNPELRKQYLGEEKVSEKEAPAKTSEESSAPTSETYDPKMAMKPINDWLSGLSQTPEVQSFYKNQTEALLKTIEPQVVNYVNKAISEALSKEVAPLKKNYGELTIREFAKTVPDFDKNRPQIEKIAKEKNLPIPDAYKLFKYEEYAKQLASKNAAQARQQKAAQVPSAKRPTSFVGEAGESMDLDKALSYAVKKAYR